MLKSPEYSQVAWKRIRSTVLQRSSLWIINTIWSLKQMPILSGPAITLQLANFYLGTQFYNSEQTLAKINCSRAAGRNTLVCIMWAGIYSLGQHWCPLYGTLTKGCALPNNAQHHDYANYWIQLGTTDWLQVGSAGTDREKARRSFPEKASAWCLSTFGSDNCDNKVAAVSALRGTSGTSTEVTHSLSALFSTSQGGAMRTHGHFNNKTHNREQTSPVYQMHYEMHCPVWLATTRRTVLCWSKWSFSKYTETQANSSRLQTTANI